MKKEKFTIKKIAAFEIIDNEAEIVMDKVFSSVEAVKEKIKYEVKYGKEYEEEEYEKV